ncbi:hypothetical protein QTP70_000506 [Hemibagrus guttatus]|uniref:Cadherin domain-containing protein n=1 Tax=Hemibagrus guttatus TaxID=175788 RepID=A0AAE0QHA2_9TELE|nr:hypothetical protein QTP70_000506 [Hemibagrus guttatus]
MEKGSRIGNIAQDLGLDLKRLKSGKSRIFSSDSAAYVELNKENGLLLIKEKIDREILCAKITPCALHLQMILENPMELYSVTVEITDINDNAPNFQKNELRFEISESAMIGARFVLGEAVDQDVGINGLQSYSLKPTDNFVLDKHVDVGKIVEMVLQKPLDREKQAAIHLSLTAFDGGEPQLSGTIHIHITVVDVNDNAPTFNQKMYKATIPENAIKGTKLITVSASDADEGSNSHVTYVMSDAMDRSVADSFLVDQKSGDVTLNGHIDYENANIYQLVIQARDQGGLSDTCKAIIDVLDINDNKPSIDVLSMSSSILEESKPNTVVAMLKVNDLDSGANGQVHCMINNNIPFTITSPSNNIFTLLTEDELDREREAEYNITLTCSDEGVPSLSSSTSLRLHISDVNDNAPVFERNNYQAYVVENNTPGLSIFTVKASDADSNQNARVSYILEESTVNGLPVSSYVSVSADSGVINVVRSFDYEQLKDFHFRIRAQDGGSPPLSSNVTVKITVQDQNDNAPQVLYPVQTGGSVVAEIVPRSADVGYLVTKVVAVDVDSGQNAWLSYKLQKATDRALFEVGAQNGEIRTVRQVTDKDAVKQKLTVVVEDNGQPSRSAVVNINVAVADTFPEVLSEFTDFTHAKQYNDDLTFYLVLALAAVSFLFIMTVVVIISVKIYRWKQSRFFYQSNLPVIPYYPPGYADTGVTGTLPHMYNYDACMTTDSRKSDCKYSTLGGQSVLVMDPSFRETLQHKIKENVCLDNDSPLEEKKSMLYQAIFKEILFFLAKIRYSVLEETKKGSVIGNIAHDLGLDLSRMRVGRARIVSGESTEYTELKTDKGTLVVNGRIDREQLCAEMTPCSFMLEIILDNPMELHHAKKYEIGVEAKDQGGLGDSAKVIVDLIDVNDNAPTITIMSFSSPVFEDAPLATTIAILSVKDLDAGENGLVICSVNPPTPFKLQSSIRNYYTLVTDAALDRERVEQYNITITASDSGSPVLSSSKILTIKISDVNDNPPKFLKNAYTTHVIENNSPGLSIFKLSAHDDDSNQNARISYFLEETAVGGASVSSYISINTDSGEVYAVRSFDYEQMKNVKVCIRAQDGGSPTLSANVTLDIVIQDQNDNAPQVLYPVQTGGSVVAEIVPRSADVGYLVTKVVAVDVDSGQNAWLSYKLQKATDRALFEVGVQNGEIRTVRQVIDKDAVKQKLTVVVEDNGQPSRSAVVNINVAVADTFPEVLSEFTDFTHAKQYNDDLTFYLVLALAAVSFLFITTVVVIISVKIYRWRQSRFFCQSNLPVIPYYPPGYTDTGITGTLPHMYNYDACMMTESRKSDCKYSTLGGQSVLLMDPSFRETLQHKIKENVCLDNDSPLEEMTPRQLKWQTVLFILYVYMVDVVFCQAQYSIPEEMPEGSFVGNIAKDLGIETRRLISGKARVVTKGSRQYVELSRDKGTLVVKERIDREELCKQTTPCSFSFDLIMENPIELHRVTVEVLDINDNAPLFLKDVVTRDGGSPPLSSEVTVTIIVQDQNDNAPQVLYPVQTGGSVVAEIVPRSADVGYLVTKVVAVDVDSGQNAWLSYKLQKATDRALFEVGAQNGEIRTVRQVTDKDAVKQKLTVVVEDNGQPSRSAVVNINVAVADTFPEVLSEFTDFTQTKQYNDDLTFYLVLALAAVSFLFITTVVVIISVKIYKWRQSRFFYQSNLPVIPYYPTGYADTGVTGTLPHMYNYDACMTTDSRKCDSSFSTLRAQNVLLVDPTFTETVQRAMNTKNCLEDPDSPESDVEVKEGNIRYGVVAYGIAFRRLLF